MAVILHPDQATKDPVDGLPRYSVSACPDASFVSMWQARGFVDIGDALPDLETLTPQRVLDAATAAGDPWPFRVAESMQLRRPEVFAVLADEMNASEDATALAVDDIPTTED